MDTICALKELPRYTPDQGSIEFAYEPGNGTRYQMRLSPYDGFVMVQVMHRPNAWSGCCVAPHQYIAPGYLQEKLWDGWSYEELEILSGVLGQIFGGEGR